MPDLYVVPNRRVAPRAQTGQRTPLGPTREVLQAAGGGPVDPPGGAIQPTVL